MNSHRSLARQPRLASSSAGSFPAAPIDRRPAGPPSAALRRGLAALVLAAAALGGASPAPAVEAESLLALPGKVVGFRYAPGSLDRAARLQRVYEPMARDLRAWTKRRPPFAVYLLERSDWVRAGFAVPYSLPARLAPSVLVQSAWGDVETVALWRRLLGTELPTLRAAPMRGSAEEAASLVPGDLLALSEAARLLLEGSGVRGERLWVAELLAHAVTVASLARREPVRLELADRFYELCRAGGPARRPLAEYRTGLTIESWLWFQGAFHEGARALVDAGGRGAVEELVKRGAKRGPIAAAWVLERRKPVEAWHRLRFEPAAADR